MGRVVRCLLMISVLSTCVFTVARAWEPTLSSVLEGVGSGNFGVSVSVAGDIDGDGFSDVIVGSGSQATVCTSSERMGHFRLDVNGQFPVFAVSASETLPSDLFMDTLRLYHDRSDQGVCHEKEVRS